MASIIKEIQLGTTADAAWDALRDFGALHTRLVRGFVTGATLDGDTRTVTFGNGMVIRETLVGVDDEHRRLAYTNQLETATHHSASAQVFENGPGCRFVWITDVLPDELAAPISDMMDAGIAAVRRTLDGATVAP